MKRTKKNNKGFSLVELIVVVLIMAIIAVALAPQVMKWVGKSKTSSDVSNYESIVSNVQLALTEDTDIADAEITFDSTGITVAGDDGADLVTALNKVTGYALDASGKSTSIKANSGTYTITVADGVVQRTTAPDGSSVDD